MVDKSARGLIAIIDGGCYEADQKQDRSLVWVGENMAEVSASWKNGHEAACGTSHC